MGWAGGPLCPFSPFPLFASAISWGASSAATFKRYDVLTFLLGSFTKPLAAE